MSPAPEATDAGWVRNPIDAFLLQRMEKHGLEPSPVADDRTLMRRLSLDLTGLVPSYEQVQSHRGIGADNARYEALVDELLASPHYGERMALPWLDWVKYSDEISDRGDYLTTFYPYRNYVIRAFNDNKPFDRFTVEQLPDDLQALEPLRRLQWLNVYGTDVSLSAGELQALPPRPLSTGGLPSSPAGPSHNTRPSF